MIDLHTTQISIQIAVCHTLQHPFILELLKRLIEGSYPMLEVSVQVSKRPVCTVTKLFTMIIVNTTCQCIHRT